MRANGWIIDLVDRFGEGNFLSILKRGLKPHPLRVVCFVLGFKSPLQNVITNYELFNPVPFGQFLV